MTTCSIIETTATSKNSRRFTITNRNGIESRGVNTAGSNSNKLRFDSYVEREVFYALLYFLLRTTSSSAIFPVAITFSSDCCSRSIPAAINEPTYCCYMSRLLPVETIDSCSYHKGSAKKWFGLIN